jgi:hypothetical protein
VAPELRRREGAERDDLESLAARIGDGAGDQAFPDPLAAQRSRYTCVVNDDQLGAGARKGHFGDLAVDVQFVPSARRSVRPSARCILAGLAHAFTSSFLKRISDHSG